jgi:LCP family protein required for cell wall assembly
MKRSLRDYLLTLGLAVLIFTVVAFFLIQAAEGLMGDVVNKIGSENVTQTQTSEEVSTLPSGETPPQQAPSSGQQTPDQTATFLLMGVDHSGQNADAVFLVGINATKKKATVALIPSNCTVSDGSNRQKLGEVYGTRRAGFYQDYVEQYVGIKPDYYGVMNMSALSNLIDFLGGIRYKVPQNMYYFDPTQNLKINLKAGNQLLTGDQAVQLVAFKGYSKGNAARENTQIEFAKAFCSAFLVPDNLSRAKSILYNVFYNVETDFEEADLHELGEMMFQFGSYEQSFGRIHGSANKDGYYNIDIDAAKKAFEIYK